MTEKTGKKSEPELRYIKKTENGGYEVYIDSVSSMNKVNDALDAVLSEMELTLNRQLATIMKAQSPKLTNEERDRFLFIVRRNFGEFYGNTKKDTAAEMADFIRSRF